MNNKILNYSFFVLSFGIGVALYRYISSFEFNSVATIACLTLIFACVGYTFYKKVNKKNSKTRLAWLFTITLLGLLVVLGLSYEWLEKMRLLFHGADFLLVTIACLAGFAFFLMVLSKEKEFYNIISGFFEKKQDNKKSFTQSFFKTMSVIFNIAFWLVLITSFNSVPWYVHVILAITVAVSTFLSGFFNENKKTQWFTKIFSGFDEIVLFFTMFAHFCAESAISAVGVAKVYAPLISTSHLTMEAVCDLEALVGTNDDHKHSHKTKSPFLALFSLAFAFCSVVLGYYEIPKAMALIGINPHTAFANVLLVVIMVLGGLSCLSVNFNCLAGGEHEHLDIRPFKIIREFKIPKFNFGKFSKATLKICVAFFGAVLNSTVGVIIAAEVFSLPTWFMCALVILAFTTEFPFHFCNQTNLSGVLLAGKKENSGSGHAGHYGCESLKGFQSKDASQQALQSNS